MQTEELKCLSHCRPPVIVKVYARSGGTSCHGYWEDNGIEIYNHADVSKVERQSIIMTHIANESKLIINTVSKSNNIFQENN